MAKSNYEVRQFLATIIIIFFCELAAAEKLDVYYINPGPNIAYSLNLKESVLKLALEKTKLEYGEFEIRHTPPMTSSRARIELAKGNIRNLVLLSTYIDNKVDSNVDYVRFPADLGLTGKRICFAGKSTSLQAKNIKSIEDLKSFKFAHGVGAFDVQILREAGLDVIEIAYEDGIYQLLKLGRADFYCRGINEIQAEYKYNKEEKIISLDESFVLVYDLPRLFFLNKKDFKAKERIDLGLNKAYNDGSLSTLLRDITFGGQVSLNLNKRKCFRLNNSHISRLDFDIKERYLKVGTLCE